MARAKIGVEFDPVVTAKVDAALARIQSRAKGIDFGGGVRSLDKLSRPLGKITGQADEFTKSLEASNARVLAFGASVAVINKLSEAFGALAKNTVEVEKTFAEIQAVLGGTEAELQKFGKGIFEAASKTGTAFSEIASGAKELARQGLGVEESLIRIETAAKLVRVAGVTSTEAISGLTAAAKGFSDAGISVTEIADKIAQVDVNFATSTKDLLEGFKRSSASAQAAGVSFDELNAILTTVTERTQRTGAVVGNAFKTIFTRVRRTDVLNQIEGLGIEVLNAEGKIRDFVPLMREVNDAIQELGGAKNARAAGILEKIAGTRQIENLLVLFEDLNKENSAFAAAMSESENAAGALDSKMQVFSNTLDFIINDIKTLGIELAEALGGGALADSAKEMLNSVRGIMKGTIDLLDGESVGSKFANAILGGIGQAMKPAAALVGVVFLKLFGRLAGFMADSFKGLIGLNKEVAAQKALQSSILQSLYQNQDLQRELLKLGGNKVAQEQLLLRVYNQQAAAQARIQKLAATVTPAVRAAGFSGGAGGIERTRRGAGGYIAAEARDVSRGVGGAPASSKVVSIPNFAFGGGKRGTMVANTSEYYVPNYAGGGDAIFNQDMVKSMGLPAGAKKINASTGYIPNFVSAAKMSSAFSRMSGSDFVSKYGRAEYNLRTRAAATGMSASDRKRKAESLRKGRGKSDFIYDPRYAMIVPGGRTGRVDLTRRGHKVAFDVVGYAGNEKRRLKNDEQLTKATEKYALGLANSEAKKMGGPPRADKIGKLANSGAISALAGTVFETAVSSLLNSKDFDARGQIAAFDFLGKSQAKHLRDNLFPGLGPAAKFIEAKIRPSRDNMRSMADKILKDKGLISKAAGGYIPNFAQDPLQNAIDRERAAGLPLNQIRINQDGRLRNAQNPKGLAVTNTRDEPTGKIPNYARGSGQTGGGTGGFMAIFAIQAIEGMANSMTDAESGMRKFTSVVSTAATTMATLSMISPSIRGAASSMESFAKRAARASAAVGRVGVAGGRVSTGKARIAGMMGGIAGIGGRIAGLAGGPVGMIAAGVLAPMIAELEIFKDRAGEAARASASNLKEFRQNLEQLTTVQEGQAALKAARDMGLGAGATRSVLEQRAISEINRRRSMSRGRQQQLESLEGVSEGVIKQALGGEAYEQYIKAIKDEENSKHAVTDAQQKLQKLEKEAVETTKERTKELQKQITTERARARGTGIMGRTAIELGRSAQLRSGGILDVQRSIATGVGMSGERKLELEQTRELLELQLEIDKGALETNKKYADALMAKQDLSILDQEAADAMYESIDANMSIAEVREKIAQLMGKAFVVQDVLTEKYKQEEKSLNASVEARKQQLKFTQETAREQQRINSGLNKYTTGLANRMQAQSEDFASNMASTLEDSMTDTFTKIGEGAYDSIGDAFLGIARDFGRELQRQITQRAVGNIMSSFSGSNAGASFFSGLKNVAGFNTGGLVTGGSGVRDDVPAALTGGEYVVKKSAVQKYGVEFLEKLNSGGLAGMQQGGFFVPGTRGQGAITGKRNLLAFATQEGTSGATDQMRGYGASGAAINLEQQSSRLTAFGRFRDSPARRALKDAQRQSFDLYVSRIEEEKRIEEEIKAAKKARNKQLQSSIIGAFTNAAMAGVGTYLQNNASSVPTFEMTAGQAAYVGAEKAAGRFVNPFDKAMGPGMSFTTPNPGSISYTPNLGYANGGSIGGNTNALLMGGEYVMSATAASQVGRQTLDSINSMNFANGGPVGNVASSSGGNMSGEGADVGEVNITINMDKDGASVTADSNGNTDPTKTKEFARKVKEVVVNVIAEEKRVSGSLFTRAK